MLNFALVIGVLIKEPQFRPLSDTTSVASFDLQVVREGETEVVPVSFAFPDELELAASLVPSQALVVIGHVRRRFFRARGTTQSRTEVVAEHLLSPDAAPLLEDAVRNLESVLSSARAAGLVLSPPVSQ